MIVWSLFDTDQSWSVDPGADLDQYDTESSPQPEVYIYATHLKGVF